MWGEYGELADLLKGFFAVAQEDNKYLLSPCHVGGALLSLLATGSILMIMKCPLKPMYLRIGPQYNCIQRWSPGR